MSTLPATPTLSRQDLDRLENEGGVEFVDGQIVEKPPVSIEAARVVVRIAKLLDTDADKTGMARVYSEMGFQCFRDEPVRVRKPDVSAVRTERLTGIDPDDAFMPIPADLAVEVLSPANLVYDVGDKVQEYLRNGFRLVWVVDPNMRTVSVHRADGTVAMLREQDEITAEDVLPDFRCRVSEFFRP